MRIQIILYDDKPIPFQLTHFIHLLSFLSSGAGMTNNSLPIPSKVDCDNEWVPFDEPPLETHEDPKHIVKNEHVVNQQGTTLDPPTNSNDAQILEEFPLPRMFIPGKILHIYTHRGGYKAAFVPRQFRQLRRVSLAGNMLSDHMSKAYYESLLEVKAIRAAKQDLPKWVGFSEDCTWYGSKLIMYILVDHVKIPH